jgi:hypothetical protein
MKSEGCGKPHGHRGRCSNTLAAGRRGNSRRGGRGGRLPTVRRNAAGHPVCRCDKVCKRLDLQDGAYLVCGRWDEDTEGVRCDFKVSSQTLQLAPRLAGPAAVARRTNGLDSEEVDSQGGIDSGVDDEVQGGAGDDEETDTDTDSGQGSGGHERGGEAGEGGEVEEQEGARADAGPQQLAPTVLALQGTFNASRPNRGAGLKKFILAELGKVPSVPLGPGRAPPPPSAAEAAGLRPRHAPAEALGVAPGKVRPPGFEAMVRQANAAAATATAAPPQPAASTPPSAVAVLERCQRNPLCLNAAGHRGRCRLKSRKEDDLRTLRAAAPENDGLVLVPHVAAIGAQCPSHFRPKQTLFLFLAAHCCFRPSADLARSPSV